MATFLRSKMKIYRHRWDKGDEALKDFEDRIGAMVDVVKGSSACPIRVTWLSDKSSIVCVVEWTIPS